MKFYFKTQKNFRKPFCLSVPHYRATLLERQSKIGFATLTLLN